MRWIAAAALVALVGAGAANAAGPPVPDPVQCLAPAFWKARLNLTDQQAAALERTLGQHRERIAPLRIEAARARLDLEEAMLPDTPDPARVEAAVGRLDRVRSQILRVDVALRLEVKRILSPQQEAAAALLLRECLRRVRRP